jgi:hypothetical protein
MTLDGIREFRDRVPFEPFEIVLVDKRRYYIPHRDFILIPPGRSTWVFVAQETGRVIHINTAVISVVQPAKRNGRRRKAG